MALFWHRRDLRPTDNVGLAAAAVEGPAVPIFVLDPAVLEHASPNRVAFLLESLEALRSAYREAGGDLLIRSGDPAEVLLEAAESHGADAVHWNVDYSGLARERDGRVASTLQDAGVETAEHEDLLLQRPGEVLTNAGSLYQVFSPFYDKWSERGHADPVARPGSVSGTDEGDVPSLDDLGFDGPTAVLRTGGHEAAMERLEAFLDGPIYRYAEARDDPAADATSRLSADLKFGTIGIRSVWAATEDALQGASDERSRESVRELQRQLAWREFYLDKLAHEPTMLTENHAEFERPIPWRNDEAEIAAWKEGRTGYPFVDAGMRQLLAEGWMHNRLRMVTAGFLTKDLLVDWRVGYDWFRHHLVDHDPANDAGGWQWAASTGWDAQPYFRVFNPTTQGERHDPHARYITRYVDELEEVDAEVIHEWPDLSDEERHDVATVYPAPIVDHADRRGAAIAAFERARGAAEG